MNKYTSGICEVCQDAAGTTDFKAKKNAKSRSDLAPLVKLPFEDLSKREQDLTFAEQRGYSLSRKIRTPNPHCVRIGHICIIGSMLYAIKYMDSTERELFIYLEEVRELAQ